MSAYRHLFVIDPIEKLNLKLDSSLRLAFALSKKQHPCFIACPNDLYTMTDEKTPNSSARAKVRQINFDETIDSLKISDLQDEPLASFEAIHIRKDPPFDMNYIAMTWIIDQVRGKSTIFNDTHALRNWNEKLIILRYPADTAPVLYSANSLDIQSFIETKCNGDAILKPLDLFEGRGIERIKSSDHPSSQLKEAIDKITQNSQIHRLVQPLIRLYTKGKSEFFVLTEKPSPGA